MSRFDFNIGEFRLAPLNVTQNSNQLVPTQAKSPHYLCYGALTPRHVLRLGALVSFCATYRLALAGLASQLQE